MKTIQYTFCLLMVAMAMSFRPVGWIKRAATGSNPAVTVNGRAVTSGAVTINSRGMLAVVAGGAESGNQKTIPFRLALKRAPMIIGRWPENSTQTYNAVSLDNLWQFARPGDELLVEPVGGGTVRVLRVIKMEPINWLPWRGSGC